MKCFNMYRIRDYPGDKVLARSGQAAYVSSGDCAVTASMPGILCGYDVLDETANTVVVFVCLHDSGVCSGSGIHGWLGAGEGNMGTYWI